MPIEPAAELIYEGIRLVLCGIKGQRLIFRHEDNSGRCVICADQDGGDS